MIQLNDEQFWLYAAGDPDTNRLLHVKLSPKRNQSITEMFLSELRAKYLVDDTLFLVDSVPWLQAALHRHDLRFQYEHYGNRNSVKCVFLKNRAFSTTYLSCTSYAWGDSEY